MRVAVILILSAIVAPLGADTGSLPGSAQGKEVVVAIIAGLPVNAMLPLVVKGDDRRDCVSVDSFTQTSGDLVTLVGLSYFVQKFRLEVSYKDDCQWVLATVPPAPEYFIRQFTSAVVDPPETDMDPEGPADILGDALGLFLGFSERLATKGGRETIAGSIVWTREGTSGWSVSGVRDDKFGWRAPQ